jgi:hypothetical protein
MLKTFNGFRAGPADAAWQHLATPWQPNGSALAADWQQIGSRWRRAWQLLAADWQRIGNKWQRHNEASPRALAGTGLSWRQWSGVGMARTGAGLEAGRTLHYAE